MAKKNPTPGIVAGILGGALNYVAAKQKRAKEEEDYIRRLKYQDDLDRLKTERDMAQLNAKNEYEDSKKQAAFDLFDQYAGYKTVPEVQTETTIGGIEPNGTIPIVQNILGLGRRTNPFEALSEEEYFSRLADLKRQDSLAGTKTAEDYVNMARKMKYSPAMPEAKYKTDINEQTGTVTYFDENNPYSKPITVSAPGLVKKSYTYNDAATNPYITRIDNYTGEIEKLGRNTSYRPQRSFSVQDGYAIAYNFETKRMDVTKIPELQAMETKKRNLQQDKEFNDRFMINMANIQSYEVAKRMGEDTVYDREGKGYDINDYAKMVKNERASLSEQVKQYLGQKRVIFDELWNKWQNDDNYSEYQFKTDLMNEVAAGLESGSLDARDAEYYSKLYYLTWGMFPSEAKKEEFKLNGRR